MHGLKQCEFAPLINTLQRAHFPGTREWVFAEVRSWLRAPNKRLLWVMGAAGTGKSVVSAKMIDTEGVKEHVVAWHFCRHDNAAESALRVLIESWAAMLCKNVAGFVVAEDVRSKAVAAATAEEMFELLIVIPLQHALALTGDMNCCDDNSGTATPAGSAAAPITAPPTATVATISSGSGSSGSGETKLLLFVLDALDELPPASMTPVLNLIASKFASLPPCVKLFVTSRGKHEVEVRLRSFEPVQIKVDELRNRADVKAYLVSIAREHFKMELTLGDLENNLETQFKLKVGTLHNKLSSIGHAIQLSQSVHNDVIRPIKHLAVFRKVLEISNRSHSTDGVELLQCESNLDRLYEDAKLAHAKLLKVFASEWEEFKVIDKGKTIFRRPVKGKAKQWVDNVIDPGLKSRDSATRKITIDYDGDARRTKDLVRFTVECDNCERMRQVLEHMQDDKDFDVLMLRNKFAAPNVLGYSDFNLTVRVKLPNDRSHICEVQVNLKEMLIAKELVHVHYEQIRVEIPAICKEAKITDKQEKIRFESSVFKLLRRSVLDTVVEELEAKAGGLFLYATLLARELQTEPGLRDISKLRQFPSGLSKYYKLYFDRMIGRDQQQQQQQRKWSKYKRAVSMIIAAREPVPRSIVEQVFIESKDMVNSLSVLFPCSDGRFEVLHKSVADWLMRPDHDYSLSSEDIETAHSELSMVLPQISRQYACARLHDMDYKSVSQQCLFALRQVAHHLCKAGRMEEAHVVVTSFGWLLARAATGSPLVLLSDIQSVNKEQSDPTTQLVASALRLALEALYEDWMYLPAQLVGRLLGHVGNDKVYGLLREVCEWKGPSEGWWCPIQPSLSPAGGSQISSFLHPASVLCAQWSSDNKLLCSSDVNTVRVWSMQSGDCVQTLKGHNSSVVSMSWSSDGKHICSGSDDIVRVWLVESGECVQTFEGHTSGVTSVSWSRDGKHICSGGGDNTVRVWLVESAECLHTLEHPSWVTSVTWGGDGKYICSGSEDNTVRVWSMESGDCVHTLEGHTSWVTSVSCSSDGKHICSGSYEVGVWLIESGEWEQTFDGLTSIVNSVSWSNDSKYICSGSEDGTVRLWSLESRDCVRTFDGHTFGVTSVSWGNDGKHICTSSYDNTVRIWSVAIPDCAYVLEGHGSHLTSISWSGDGKHICSGSYDNTMKVWSLESGECVRTFESTSTVYSVSWSSDSKHICSGSADNTVRVWLVENGECVRIFEGHTSVVRSVGWSNDDNHGKHICSGSEDNTVRVWSVESKDCVHTLEGHTARVTSVSWSSDGKHICSSSDDQTVRVWSVENGECLQTLRGHTSGVISVAWSSDGKYVCSGDTYDATVRVWSVASGECMRILRGHISWVTSVSWSSDDKYIYGVSPDNIVKVWSVEDGLPLPEPYPYLPLWNHWVTQKGGPIGFQPQMLYLLSSDLNRCFAQTDVDKTNIHSLRALGGSRPGGCGDSDFLTHHRKHITTEESKVKSSRNTTIQYQITENEALMDGLSDNKESECIQGTLPENKIVDDQIQLKEKSEQDQTRPKRLLISLPMLLLAIYIAFEIL